MKRQVDNCDARERRLQKCMDLARKVREDLDRVSRNTKALLSPRKSNLDDSKPCQDNPTSSQLSLEITVHSDRTPGPTSSSPTETSLPPEHIGSPTPQELSEDDDSGQKTSTSYSDREPTRQEDAVLSAAKANNSVHSTSCQEETLCRPVVLKPRCFDYKHEPPDKTRTTDYKPESPHHQPRPPDQTCMSAQDAQLKACESKPIGDQPGISAAQCKTPDEQTRPPDWQVRMSEDQSPATPAQLTRPSRLRSHFFTTLLDTLRVQVIPRKKPP